MKPGIAFLVLIFLMATAPAARAFLYTPPLFIPPGGWTECAIANIANRPLLIAVQFNYEDDRSSDVIISGPVEPQHILYLFDIPPTFYSQCGALIVGGVRFGPARFVRVTLTVFDAEGNIVSSVSTP